MIIAVVNILLLIVIIIATITTVIIVITTIIMLLYSFMLLCLLLVPPALTVIGHLLFSFSDLHLISFPCIQILTVQREQHEPSRPIPWDSSIHSGQPYIC